MYVVPDDPRHLSTPSLGITGIYRYAFLRLRNAVLSTPSLGITALWVIRDWQPYSPYRLSTPSLGITSPRQPLPAQSGDEPFNSLSRDHRVELVPEDEVKQG